MKRILLVLLFAGTRISPASGADEVPQTRPQPATSIQEVTWNVVRIHRKFEGRPEFDEWLLSCGGFLHDANLVTCGVTFDEALKLIFAADSAPQITIGLPEMESRCDMQEEVMRELQKNPAFHDHPPLTQHERARFPHLYKLVEAAILKTSCVQELNRRLQARNSRISSVSLEDLRIVRQDGGYMWLANGALLIGE